MTHSYEELRAVVVDILLGRESIQYGPSRFEYLVRGVAQVLARREGQRQGAPHGVSLDPCLLPQDAELVRDIFWDLFRQGFITLGLNDANPGWPFFRLSHFGKRALGTQSPFRFHDTGSFLAIVKREVPDISPEAFIYLEEATAAFFADCLLATCVMLGVAAEAEFLRLVDVAAKGVHARLFAAVPKETFIRRKITRFHESLGPLLKAKTMPKEAVEDLDTNFAMIQSVLRVARNEAGHPTAADIPTREQVYVYLQLFIPFARQLMRVRAALA